MDEFRKIVEALNQLTSSERSLTRLAKVEEVTSTTCRVTLLDSSEELDEVRLMAVDDPNVTDNFIVFPSVGSIVTISPLGSNSHVYMVTSTSEVEKIAFNKEGTSLSVSGETFTLNSGGKAIFKNSEVSLKELLDGIVDIIKTLTVRTATGPSQLPLPPTLQKCEDISNSIQTLFSK